MGFEANGNRGNAECGHRNHHNPQGEADLNPPGRIRLFFSQYYISHHTSAFLISNFSFLIEP
jgi:hypothetical protein